MYLHVTNQSPFRVHWNVFYICLYFTRSSSMNTIWGVGRQGVGSLELQTRTGQPVDHEIWLNPKRYCESARPTVVSAVEDIQVSMHNLLPLNPPAPPYQEDSP